MTHCGRMLAAGLAIGLAAAAGAANIVKIPDKATAQDTAKSTPAARPCLTPAEVEQLVAMVLPGTIEGLAQKCRGTLGTAAYLVSSGPALAARFRRENPVDPSGARLAVEKLSGDQMPAGMSDELSGKLVEAFASAAVVEQVQTKDCATVSTVIELLAPLPANNTARLVAMLADLGSRGDKADSPFRVCPAVAAR